MYTDINFKTKKELKEYVKAGHCVGVHQPNNIFDKPRIVDGICTVEGAWYPAPHTWYAQVELRSCCIVSVK